MHEGHAQRPRAVTIQGFNSQTLGITMAMGSDCHPVVLSMRLMLSWHVLISFFILLLTSCSVSLMPIAPAVELSFIRNKEMSWYLETRGWLVISSAFTVYKFKENKSQLLTSSTICFVLENQVQTIHHSATKMTSVMTAWFLTYCFSHSKTSSKA